MSAQTDHHTAVRRLGVALFVLIVSAVFCFGLSSLALADDAATTAHEEPAAQDTGGANEWHPEEESAEHPETHPEEPTDGHTDGESEETEEEIDPHPEEPADCEADSDEEETNGETEAHTAADDECESDDADDDSDDDGDDDSEDDSDDDDECEIPGVNDGDDDRADDDEDDTDCVTVEEPGDDVEEEGGTEVLATSTRRPALAATGFGLPACTVVAGGLLVAGGVLRGRRPRDEA